VFDLDTEAFYGPLQIQNCHHIQATPGSGTINLAEAYCMDADGKWEDLVDRTSATSVERRLVQFRIGSTTGFLPAGDPTFPSPTAETDHNGYAFASLRLDAASNIDRIRLIVDEWGGDDTTSPQPYHVYASETDEKEKGWLPITADTAVDYNGLAGDDSNTVQYQADLDSWTVFAFQQDPAWTLANKATISGRCEDANGVGLAGCLVWMVTNGRWEYTNFAGDYNIRTYGDGGGVRSALQVLYATYPPDVQGAFEPVPNDDSHAFNLDDDSNGTADTWTPPDFVFGFLGGILYEERILKSGGIYKWGIVYEDDFGRNCGVSQTGTLDIPFHTEDGQYAPRTATFAIHSLPPLWATKYRIVRTKDTFYQRFKQSPVGNVKYAVIPDGATDPEFTTYSSNNATHIMLSVPSAADGVTVPAGTVLLMFRSQRTDGYRAHFGDRVRYVLDEQYATVFSDRVLEVDVLGEYIEGNEYFVVIPYTEINREVIKGWVFEFFTPKGFEEEIYYETGVCLPIIEPNGTNRRHSGITQDQDTLLDIPATGPVLTGDTYWWREQFVFSSDFGAQLVTENWRRSKFVTDHCEDIGRPFFYDPTAGERFYFNRIRFSGTYVPSSQINDLNAYGVADFQNLNRMFGPIKWAAMVHNVLLCICQNKVQSVYVGKGRIMDLSGNTQVGRSNSILNIADETLSNAGTLNPESIVNEGGNAWWWDLQNAKVRRYGADGVSDINFGKNNYFRTRAIERFKLTRPQDIVVGGYDRKHDLYLLTFAPGVYVLEGQNVNVLSDTLGYDAVRGGWRSHFSFVPDCYSALNFDLIMFASEKLWTCFKGTINNYFNVQYANKITFVANEAPDMNKDWLCMREQSNRLWTVSEVLTISGQEYTMRSKLTAANFVLKENHWFADFLRDMTDPHTEFTSISNQALREATAALRGRYLKGEAITITMDAVGSTTSQVLWSVSVDWADSQVTPQ
jgi:hypothetical protein